MSIIERVECLVESQRACMEFLPHTEQDHRDDYDRNTKELIADIKAMEQSIPDNSLSRETCTDAFAKYYEGMQGNWLENHRADHSNTFGAGYVTAIEHSRVDVEALRGTVTAAIYDAFHNMTVPSMAGKFNTMGECKDYVTKVVTEALALASGEVAI